MKASVQKLNAGKQLNGSSVSLSRGLITHTCVCWCVCVLTCAQKTTRPEGSQLVSITQGHGICTLCSDITPSSLLSFPYILSLFTHLTFPYLLFSLSPILFFPLVFSFLISCPLVSSPFSFPFRSFPFLFLS